MRKFFGAKHLAVLTFSACLALAGCAGQDGTDGVNGINGVNGTNGANGADGANGNDGAQGPTGPQGPAGVDGATAFYLADITPDALFATIDSVTIPADGKPVVDFTVKDKFGRLAVGLVGGSTGNVRFILAKLVPGNTDLNRPDTWQSYINNSSKNATTERTGTFQVLSNGKYRYKFAANVTNITSPVAVPYDATATHRLAIQISGSVGGKTVPPVDPYLDFVPAGGTPTSRLIFSTTSCNECHTRLAAHGSRVEGNYCVTCHNPGSSDPDTSESVEMSYMTHAIHGASIRNADGAPNYFGFAEVTYPQDLKNCRKCHNGSDPATPQGDNWKNKPSLNACRGCHYDVVNFHITSGPMYDVSTRDCSTCHLPNSIENYHLSANSTPNNPNVPLDNTGAPAANFSYEIKTVTVDSSPDVNGTTRYRPVVTFKIKKDGADLSLATYPPTNFSGGPSFRVAYSSPVTQNGASIDSADWNQLGKADGQPVSVSLSNVVSGSQGTLTGPDGQGFYTATITGSNFGATYPSDAVMHGVFIEGSFTQTNMPNGSLSRQTISVFAQAAADTVKRRVIVDDLKCSNCHEWFIGHGGSRVYSTMVCVVCHNPSLSSSGRASTVAQVDSNATERAKLVAAGYITGATTEAQILNFPEASNNFKDMIHGIHGSAIRENPFRFVRNRSGAAYYYDFSEITFPSEASNCLVCHRAGTYKADLAANVMASKTKTLGADLTVVATDTVNNGRNTVPNNLDSITSPGAATCVACHDSAMAKAHITDEGGVIDASRVTSYYEMCVLCHGEGKLANTTDVHPL